MSKYMTLLLSSVLLIITMSLPFTYGDASSVIPSNATYSLTFNCGDVYIIDHPYRQQNQQLQYWTGESEIFVRYGNRTLHLFNHWVRINQLHWLYYLSWLSLSNIIWLNKLSFSWIDWLDWIYKMENFGICLVIVFIFYFQKLVLGNIKKKQFSCIFEIKNIFG